MRTFSKSFIKDFEGQDIMRKNFSIFSAVPENPDRKYFQGSFPGKKFKNFFSGNENKK